MDGTIYDVCIVGAGMFGSAAARHASANVGVKVCLIGPDEPTAEERKIREIFSAHYDEGRITRSLDDQIPLVVLSKHSISRYRQLEDLSGINFYDPVGLLYITKKGSSYSKTLLQTANASNLPTVDLSYNSIFQKRYPYVKVKDDDLPILDDFGAGHISPRNMVAAQKKVAKKQGCDIIPQVVKEVKPLQNGIHEISTENGNIIKSKRVLICTGAFTNFKNILMKKLKMDIHKETVAFFRIPEKEANRLSAMPSIIYNRIEDKIGAYILPPIKYPDGYYYLKIGDSGKERNFAKSLKAVKEWYLSEGDPVTLQKIKNIMIGMLPGLNYDEVTPFTCVTAHSPSGLPYIDRISPTVTVAAVGNGKGAKFSEEVGRIAATLSLTGRWDSELSQSDFSVIYEA